ncbi:MAG TPA: DUF2520 domain-containing protein [Terriglobales bacterium]
MKRPSLAIAIVGGGRLGTALALHLFRAGYHIAEIVSRDSQSSLVDAKKLARRVESDASSFRNARLDADLVWFCVPDSDIGSVAAKLSAFGWWEKGKIAFHSSGVLTSDVLQALRKRGAAVASVHPLMTFVRGSVPDLAAVPFAIEGDGPAVQHAFKVVRDLGGTPGRIRKEDKVSYHAFATMICPLLVALLAAAEETAGAAGLSREIARRRMMPIIRQTLANYAKVGPAKSFSGPIVRGDVETIKQHLKALAKAPAAKRAYIALAESSLEYLPNRNRREIERLLRNFVRD